MSFVFSIGATLVFMLSANSLWAETQLSAAALQKIESSTLILNCKEGRVLSTQLQSMRVTIGRPARAKDQCVKRYSTFLASPYLSWDMAVEKHAAGKNFANVANKIPHAGDRVFSITQERPVQIAKILSLIDSCKAAADGVKNMGQLPAEERATHPDQNYGFSFWNIFCNTTGSIKPIKTVSRPLKTLKIFKVTEGSVLWSDDKNIIIQIAPGPNGAPVFNETLELVGIRSNAAPFPKPPDVLKREVAVAKVLVSGTFEALEKARQNGLWDY